MYCSSSYLKNVYQLYHHKRRIEPLCQCHFKFCKIANWHCKMILDCTDIEIAAPSLMSEQTVTYSTYRGITSFKALIGIAPKAVKT